MKSKFLTGTVTVIVLIGINYGLKLLTHTRFIDYSCLIGLIVTALIWFFTSKGGFTTKNLDVQVQGATGIKMEQEKLEFTPKTAFYTSVAYTLISLILTFIYYRNYF